jgi:hypothetical protein
MIKPTSDTHDIEKSLTPKIILRYADGIWKSGKIVILARNYKSQDD